MKCQNKLIWLVTVTCTLRYRFEYELSTLTKKTVIINISKFESHLKNDYETLILNPRWIKLNNEIFVFLNCPPKTVQDQANPTHSSTTSSLKHVAEYSIIQTDTQIIVYS